MILCLKISRQFYNYRDSSPSDPLAQSQPQSNSKSSSRSLYRSLLVSPSLVDSCALQNRCVTAEMYGVFRVKIKCTVTTQIELQQKSSTDNHHVRKQFIWQFNLCGNYYTRNSEPKNAPLIKWLCISCRFKEMRTTVSPCRLLLKYVTPSMSVNN